MGSAARSLAICLVLAFFIVKGFLSWLADVSIWALQALESDKSLAPTDQELVPPVSRVQEVSQEPETKRPSLALRKTGSARSHAGSPGVWNEWKTTAPGTAATRNEGRPKLLDVATGRSEVAPLIDPKTDFASYCDYTLARLHNESAGTGSKWYGLGPVTKLSYKLSFWVSKLSDWIKSTSASHKL